MPTVAMRWTDGEALLGEDHVKALLWAWKLAAHEPTGTGGNALSRLLVSGGSFDVSSCGQVLAFCRIARDRLGPKTLEVYKPKYGKNVCLTSEAGYELVLRHKLRYLNKNVTPNAVYVGKTRAPGGDTAQTLAEVLPLAEGLELVEQAACARTFEGIHSDPVEYL